MGKDAMEMLSTKERSKSKHKFIATKVCVAEKVGEYFINLKTKNETFGSCVKNEVIFSLVFRNISCSTSKNMLSEIMLKYHVSMLNSPSHAFQNPFEKNKTREPLLQLHINRKFQKYVSLSR